MVDLTVESSGESKEADGDVRSAYLRHSLNIKGYVLGCTIRTASPSLACYSYWACWMGYVRDHDPLRRKQCKRTGIAPNPSPNP